MTRAAQEAADSRRILPTAAMTCLRQLEMIDLTASLGGPDCLPVMLAEISAHMPRKQVSKATVSSAQGFLRQGGLVESHGGAISLTAAGLRLTQLRGEDSARARLFLCNLWKSAWITTSAQQLLRQKPLDRIALADQLCGPYPRERGLVLVDWLDYALIVHQGEDGLLRLPQVEQNGRPSPAAGLPLMRAEEVSALPDDTFHAVMQAYEILLTSLRGSPAAA
ncbi:hypothetical protein EDD96_4909 [Streptomyces sp. Ag109_G2-6]|uniref:hypothetical protein n=1 Tax=Streptomyces sp. Ag109_G2-6 TaxID=2485154 RepID=UPI000F4FCE58|nr:hypothetical protein [Streptomyces sp. Ag109_G2-6]RPF41119.1 hypothetical protein EDD96_4909 [Streptomyces sp. Ag109_G2-6]